MSGDKSQNIDDLPRPGATSVYVKEPEGDHHYPFACVLHFKKKEDALKWWDLIEIEAGD